MTETPPPFGPLVDTHAHLDDDRLRSNLADVLQTARSAGVAQIIAVATTAADSARVLALADGQPGVFATVGFQPNNLAEAAEGDWETIVDLARRPRVVALGETGLDRYWDFAPFDLQQDWFDRHLRLADELKLPVVIHCREAEADVAAQLAALNRPVRGVLHSFTGSIADAERFLELGLHVSFAGMLTYTNKKLDALRAAAASIPLDRLLVETDSPYLSPHPLRGRPNQPAHVVWTALKLAELLSLTPGELAAVTTANARRLFALPDGDVS